MPFPIERLSARLEWLDPNYATRDGNVRADANGLPIRDANGNLIRCQIPKGGWVANTGKFPYAVVLGLLVAAGLVGAAAGGGGGNGDGPGDSPG